MLDQTFPNQRAVSFPNIINIEVYRGHCPCRCPHCPLGVVDPSQREERFGVKHLSLNLFQKVIDEMAEFPHSAIRLHSVGEPILWENMIPAIQYSQQKNVKTWIFSSGVTKNQALLETLCRHADIIEISINSTNAEDYAKEKGVYQFELVQDNINHMRAYIKENHLPTRLLVSRVSSIDPNQDQHFLSCWKNKEGVADAFIREYHTYNQLLGELDPAKVKKKTQPCLVHWTRFNISVDGDSVVCFNELFKSEVDPDLIFGNIKTQSIQEIWKSDLLNAIRQAEFNGTGANAAFYRKLPCNSCTTYQPYFENDQKSEAQVEALACVEAT